MLLSFDNASYKESFEVDGEKFEIEVDVPSLFKLKMLAFLREGLKLENVVSNNKGMGCMGYTFYISVPEFFGDNMKYNFSSPMMMCAAFKKWITRMLFYKHSEDEYVWLKEHGKVNIEVKAKIRKGEQWNDSMGNMNVKATLFSWNMKNKLGDEEYAKFAEKMGELQQFADKVDEGLRKFGIGGILGLGDIVVREEIGEDGLEEWLENWMDERDDWDDGDGDDESEMSGMNGMSEDEKANLLANMKDLLAKYNELVEEYPDIREVLGGIL